MTTEADQYPVCVQAELERLEKDREKILSYVEHGRICEEVAQEFKPQVHNIRTSIGYRFGSVEGALLKVDVMDMRDVLPILRDLRKRGYKIEKHEDYPEMKRRTYRLGDIAVLCFLMGDTKARCQWVKVGEKSEPVYKLMCDDGTDMDQLVEADGAEGGAA